LDPKEDDGFGKLWPNQHKFGEVLVEFDQSKAWIDSVAWAPSGMQVLFSGHGSTLHFVTLTPEGPIVQTLPHQFLPFCSSAFLNDNCVVVAGYDNNPVIFANNNGTWEFKDVVDKEAKKEVKAQSATSAARQMFQNVSSQGVKFGEEKAASKKPLTQHANTITDLRLPYSVNASSITEFSTSGIDGRVITWNLKQLAPTSLADWHLA
jgi:actin related protein 2/3 complex subunit 1A/1B